MNTDSALKSAIEIIDRALLYYQDQAVGTVAAMDPAMVAPNYEECFVRDFVPCALVFLMDGKTDIVRHFLELLIKLSGQQPIVEGHERALGLMPASFRVPKDQNGSTPVLADFGERAIGRVAPVDSSMWWMLILRSYVVSTGDLALAHRADFQETMRLALKLYLKESFETSPAMLVPDASFMIDRRMDVYGHPLEIQALFYGMLQTAQELLLPTPGNVSLLALVNKRLQTLRSYVRIYYWLDQQRLNEIHRFHGEEFGLDAVNVLNIYPESIPDWLDGWLPGNSGYLVGNLGPGRIDFRFFSFGNLLAIMFGLATESQAENIMNLFAGHWDTLIGNMPVKICYPAVSGQEWVLTTGSDPKNAPWSYHNGGHWPCLLWAFTGAAIRTGRHGLARRAIDRAIAVLPRDDWPEYYDGKTGSLVGRRANLKQTWTAAALVIAHRLLKDRDSMAVFKSINF